VQQRTQQQAILGEPIAFQRGSEGEIRYTGTDTHGIRYDAYIAGDREPITSDLTAQDRARYLEPPPSGLSRALREKAHEWADAQPTAYLKAKAIEEHLKTEYKYDTASPSAGKPDPVDHFLFDSKRGHCEFFSTAMALMLREVGIPSRNVTGFVGGTYNRFGRYYAVREGDAHSWVEAYIDDPLHGWHTFDPTPTAGARPLQDTTGAYVYLRDLVEALSQRWNRYVVGYDLKTQVRIFDDISRRYQKLREQAGVDTGVAEKVTRGPVITAALLLAGFAAYTWWRRRRAAPKGSPESRDDPQSDARLEAATALYRSLEAALTAQGIGRPTALPPLKHAEELAARAHPLADDVLSLTNTYLEARFGGSSIDSDAARDFERRVKDIRTYRTPEPAEPSAP